MMPDLCSIVVGMLLFVGGLTDEPANASEKTAINELEKLGARVVFKSLESDGDDSKQQLWFVLIDKSWKGGDEGLKHIEQIPNLSTLYITGRPKISTERLEKLKKTMPGLAIERRTSVFLGINPVAKNGSVVLRQVLPNSPADKAGLKAGDLIQKFDQKTVKDVNELITALQPKEPDDEVDVIVRRNDMSITVKVKLGTWPQSR